MDIEVKMPDIGIDEVEVVEILVKINDTIELEQGIITVEGDKASMEIPSPTSGTVKNIYIKIGDKVKTSSTLMVLKTDSIDQHTIKNETNLVENDKKTFKKNLFLNSDNSRKNIFVHASPVVRRLARTLNVELHDIIPTGPKNRILKEDVESYIKKLKINKEIEYHPIHSFDIQKIDKLEIELSHLQKVTGNNLSRNWKNIPHVTQFDECNITILEQFRHKYNTENHDISNITILVFILKVVSYALEKFPIFNSSLSYDNKKIILNKYINIGFAVEVQDGLFVPVIKNVNKKNIQELSSELICLSKKAREKKLHQSDMSYGSFTISNLGGIGGCWFSPIINAPEVAILGISQSRMKPLWNGKEFIPSLMLPLSLSYDHRVINGADAARFITLIGKLLSDMHFLMM